MQKSNNLLQDAFETAGKVQDLLSSIYCDLLEACCYLNFLKVYFHHAMAEPSSSSSHELGILGDIEKMGGSSWPQRGQVKTAPLELLVPASPRTSRSAENRFLRVLAEKGQSLSFESALL